MGLDFSYSFISTEELERVGVGLANGICHRSDIVSPYISSCEIEKQKLNLFSKSITGEFISAIALTEPGTGSDLAGVRITAKRDGDYYILNGEKTFITRGESMKLAEKRALKKKEEILMAAVAIVNRRGYSGATMEEIATDLLMTKGALYYYFKNKGDLMFQCHNLVLGAAIDEQEEHLREGGKAEAILRAMIITHIDYAIEEKESFNMILMPEQIFTEEQLAALLELRKYYSHLFDQIINRGVESGEFEVNDSLISRMIILGSMNWIQQWYRPGGRLSKEQFQMAFGDLILKLLK